MTVDAFATDGSHLVRLYNQEAGPGTTEVPTDLSPDAEYAFLIGAKSDWSISLRPQSTHALSSEPLS